MLIAVRASAFWYWKPQSLQYNAVVAGSVFSSRIAAALSLNFFNWKKQKKKLFSFFFIFFLYFSARSLLPHFLMVRMYIRYETCLKTTFVERKREPKLSTLFIHKCFFPFFVATLFLWLYIYIFDPKQTSRTDLIQLKFIIFYLFFFLPSHSNQKRSIIREYCKIITVARTFYFIFLFFLILYTATFEYLIYYISFFFYKPFFLSYAQFIN